MKEARTSSISRKGQRRRMRLFFFVILCFFVWTSYTLFLQSGELSKKEDELEVLKQESVVLKQKQEELTYEASRLNDQEYLAELVRKRILFTKEGESIYIIPD